MHDDDGAGRGREGHPPGQWQAVAAALADERRLRLYARIVTAAEQGSPLDPQALDRNQTRSLAVLQRAGLVEAAGGAVVPVPTLFPELLRRDTVPPDQSPRRFLVRGRIEVFPRRRADRLELLHYLAGEVFEDAPHAPATPPVLDERQLTERLGRYTADPVLIRRYLVDENIVTRDPAGRAYRLARPRPATGMDFA